VWISYINQYKRHICNMKLKNTKSLY
jgi:hypothetical protein